MQQLDDRRKLSEAIVNRENKGTDIMPKEGFVVMSGSSIWAQARQTFYFTYAQFEIYKKLPWQYNSVHDCTIQSSHKLQHPKWP